MIKSQHYSTLLLSFVLILITIGVMIVPEVARSQTGELRAIHLSPGAPGVDVYVGSETDPVAPNVQFGSASAAPVFPAGSVDIRVTPAGNNAITVLNQTVPITAGQRLNVHAFNTLASIEAVATTFDLGSPTYADSAFVRIVHASPDVTNVDIRLSTSNGNQITLPNIPFKTVSQFYTLPVGDLKIELFAAGTQHRLLAVSGELSGDFYGTLFVSGLANDLTFHLLNETDANQQRPMPMLTALGEANVRAVHLVADGPAVDLFIDNTTPPAVSNVAYRDASEDLLLEEGSYNIKIGPTGLGLQGAVIDADIQPVADSGYVIYATGLVSTLDLAPVVLTRDINTAPSAGNALVRLLHASPVLDNVDITITDANDQSTTSTNLAFRTATEYSSFRAGKVSVQVAESGGGKRIYSGTGTLVDGGVLTIIASGDPNDKSFKINLLVDSDNTAQVPMAELVETVVEEAFLRAVHLVDDQERVSLFVENKTPALFSDFSFRNATSLKALPSDEYNLKVVPEGQPLDNAFIDINETLSTNIAYTMCITGSVSGDDRLSILLSRDKNVAPESGKTLVRVLNASFQAGNLDIIMTTESGAQQALNGHEFRTASDYEEFPSEEIFIDVYPTGGARPILSASGFLPTDGIVTIIANGDPSENDFVLNLLVESDDAEQKPMLLLMAEVETTTIRAVHLSPDAGSVEFFVDDVEMDDLTYYDASKVFDFGAGFYNVKVSPEGTSPSGAVINENLELPANNHRAFFVVGKTADQTLDLVAMNAAIDQDIPSGRALLRFLHADPDTGPVDVEFSFNDQSTERITNIDFKGTTVYVEAPEGNVGISIFEPNSNFTQPLYETSEVMDGAVTVILSSGVDVPYPVINLLFDDNTNPQKPLLTLPWLIGSVEQSGTYAISTQIAPHPVKDIARLKYTLEIPTQIGFDVYDVTGKNVLTHEVGSVEVGERIINIDVAVLVSGGYTLLIRDLSNDRVIGMEQMNVVR